MMTLGNMRQHGVHSLPIYCGALWCHHQAVLDVAAFADNVTVPSFGPLLAEVNQERFELKAMDLGDSKLVAVRPAHGQKNEALSQASKSTAPSRNPGKQRNGSEGLIL